MGFFFQGYNTFKIDILLVKTSEMSILTPKETSSMRCCLTISYFQISPSDIQSDLAIRYPIRAILDRHNFAQS